MDTAATPGARSPRRILVRIPNWIGDAVLSTAVLKKLTSTLPDSEITLVAHRRVAPIFLPSYEGMDVVVFDPAERDRGVRGLVRFSRRIRRNDLDLALVLPLSFSSALMAYLSGARERIGYSTEHRGRLLTRGISLSADYRDHHLVDHYQGLLETLGIDSCDPRPEVQVTPEADDSARRHLGRCGVEESAPLVGIAPGASYGLAKRWPENRFASVARSLSREFSLQILVLGGLEDAGLNGFDGLSNSSVIDLTGKTSLGEAAAMIRRCQLFISNDSGLMHVAAAVGTPVVAIFGSTSPVWTGPIGEGHTVIAGQADCAPCFARACRVATYDCLERVQVEDVLEAARGKLAAGVARRGT
jgi:heptosyltransferase-2